MVPAVGRVEVDVKARLPAFQKLRGLMGGLVTNPPLPLLLLLLLLAIATGAEGASEPDPRGVAGCPCVDAWAAGPAPGTNAACDASELFVAGTGDSSDASAGGRCWPRVDAVKDPQTGAVLTASDGIPLPSWYGASVCHSWDGDGRECRAAAEAVAAGTPGAEVPKLCNSKWCFVDAAACEAAGVRFDFSSSPEVALEDRPIWFDGDAVVPSVGSYGLGKAYSYETCGSVNDFTPSAILKTATGRARAGTLRVGFPGNSNAFLYNAVEPGGAPRPVEDDVGPDRGRAVSDVTIPIGGAVLDFYSSSLGTIGLPTTIIQTSVEQGGFRKAISQGSLSLYPRSTYSACTHDVGSGALDLCLGPFWPTAERIAMPGVAFTIPFDGDIMVSVVRVPEDAGRDAGWLATFTKPFDVFSVDLWVLIVGSIIALAVVYYAIENPYDRMEISENAPWRVRMGESVFLGFSGAIGGEFNFARARSLAGRFILLSSGFFVLIITSSYTANLASTLVSAAASEGLLTVAKAVRGRLPVCGYNAIASEMEAELGVPRQKYVGLGDHVKVLQALKGIDEAGDPLPGGTLCDIGVITLADWQSEAALGSSDRLSDGLACGLVLSQESGLLELPLAIPVRLDLVEGLSWITQTRRYEPLETSFGTVYARRSKELFQVLKDGHKACRVGGQAVSAQESRSQLRASDFAGLAIILLTISVVASVLQSLPACVSWWKSPGDEGSWSGVRFHDDFVRRDNDFVFLRRRVAERRAAREESRVARRESTAGASRRESKTGASRHQSTTGAERYDWTIHSGQEKVVAERPKAAADEWKAIALAAISQQPSKKTTEILRLLHEAETSGDANVPRASTVIAKAVEAQVARAEQIRTARLNNDADGVKNVVLRAFKRHAVPPSPDSSTARQAKGWKAMRRAIVDSGGKAEGVHGATGIAGKAAIPGDGSMKIGIPVQGTTFPTLDSISGQKRSTTSTVASDTAGRTENGGPGTEAASADGGKAAGANGGGGAE